MRVKNNSLLKNYISNVQVNLLLAGYTHVWEDWHQLDYIPEFNRFYLIQSGEGWLKIGDKEYYPTPGQLFIMPTGIKQSFSTINSNTFTKYWCHFTATIGDKNLFDIIQLPHFINVEKQKELEDLFKELINFYCEESFTSCLRAKSKLLEIISFFIENTTVENIQISSSPNVEKLNQVLAYIERNLSQNISVEELAEILHFHPNYFIKFFRNHLGSSPIHYINKMKMERAKSLLGMDDSTVTEVADAVGFGDIYHFSKAFKNYTGFSPKEYRNIEIQKYRNTRI